MITQQEISKLAFRLGMNDKVIEKDYMLTWILHGLAEAKVGKILAFKGGTALKKIYFPDYRYSEDLDFTLIEKIADKDLILKFEKMLNVLSKKQAFQFVIPLEKIERRSDSLTFYIDFVGPLQAKLGSRDIKVDFTFSEKLLFPVNPKTIHSGYSDTIPGEIITYSLEEILVEKLCAIIGRNEPRDIYDTNFLFGLKEIDFHIIPDAFEEKAKFKGVDHRKIKNILDKKRPLLVRTWETRLQNQVKDLPHLEEVLRELNRNLKKHL